MGACRWAQKGAMGFFAPVLTQKKGEHKDVLADAVAKGFARIRVDGEIFEATAVPKLARYKLHDIEVEVGRRRLFDGSSDNEGLASLVHTALHHGDGRFCVIGDDTNDVEWFSTRSACESCGDALPEADPRVFAWNNNLGACPVCEGRGTLVIEDKPKGRLGRGRKSGPKGNTQGQTSAGQEVSGADDAQTEITCPSCKGYRLGPAALAIRIRDRGKWLNIGEVAALSISELKDFIGRVLNPVGTARRTEVSTLKVPDVLRESLEGPLTERLTVLENLGLGYLSLGRGFHTLSTGEAQRVRIVAQLASNLRGACYVLDEPTVGLHPRDTAALITSLESLRDAGNTVMVVEHEGAVIQRADHVIDLGPVAGKDGGFVVAQGTVKQVAKSKKSLTGAWLRGHGGFPKVATSVAQRRRNPKLAGGDHAQPRRTSMSTFRSAGWWRWRGSAGRGSQRWSAGCCTPL